MKTLTNKKTRLVGEFIRNRRESLGISQRALGLMFTPTVTTQFISNVERGVTPLPPMHIPALAKVLMVSESEITTLLEKEYAYKLSDRLGRAMPENLDPSAPMPSLTINGADYGFMRSLYDAYRTADDKTRQAFMTVCESILSLPKTGT